MNSTVAAAGTADTAVVDSMTKTFSDLAATGMAALAAIAGIAILLFAGRYAWSYGKKIFSIIAK